jgi:hypothetical protein
MTDAIIDYVLFIAVFGAVLSIIAGAVAALWSWARKK